MSDEIVQLTRDLKDQAFSLGFHLCGVCPSVQPDGYHRLLDWLDNGYDGTMSYLSQRRDAYRDPEHVMSGTRSLLVLGMPYRTIAPEDATPNRGRVARYAWGTVDYHDHVHKRLKLLKRWLEENVTGAEARGVVDTAPLLEREFAQLAGIGWIGKNTLMINKFEGSYFFLAALLTNLQLEYDLPHETSHCGKCQACLDACPTDAFPHAGTLDATKCISYLTIEHREAIPRELRPQIGDWFFGCDVCQEVCPWNRRGSHTNEQAFYPQENHNPASLLELFDLNDEQFRARYRKTPLWRSKRRGILRNAAIVLGNTGNADSIEALRKGITDTEPVVRGACAWAIGRIGGEVSLQILKEQLQSELDPEVREEINHALQA